MQLTKFGHSCVRLVDGGRTLVIDPGSFSDAAEALHGADAVLITHEHPDHVDEAALRAAAAAHPALHIWAPAPVAATFADLGDQVSVAGAGESFEAAGYAISTFGGQHALIHSSIPIVANVGYLIDGLLYHPGDSFVVPNVAVSTLLVPTNAPWLKVGELIDFMVSVRASQAYQIHDALINELGTNLVEGLIARTTAAYGTTFEHLALGMTISL